MLSRRKFFALIAGALSAPKALLTAPLQMKLRQPGITAPNGCGGYARMHGSPDDFLFFPSPRMNCIITGITTPDEDTNGNQS